MMCIAHNAECATVPASAGAGKPEDVATKRPAARNTASAKEHVRSAWSSVGTSMKSIDEETATAITRASRIQKEAGM